MINYLLFFFFSIFGYFYFHVKKTKLLIYFAKKKRNFGKFNIYSILFKIKFNTEKYNILI